jgi:hypothetical protein
MVRSRKGRFWGEEKRVKGMLDREDTYITCIEVSSVYVLLERNLESVGGGVGLKGPSFVRGDFGR